MCIVPNFASPLLPLFRFPRQWVSAVLDLVKMRESEHGSNFGGGVNSISLRQTKTAAIDQTIENQLYRVTRMPARLCLALALALLFLLSPASALASPLTSIGSGTRSMGGPVLQVNAGFDGRYRNGSWVPIHITLHNTGADFSGTLAMSNPLSPIMQTAGFTTIPVSMYQQRIALPHGKQQQITMYLPIYTLYGAANVAVQLLDSRGNVVQSQTTTLHELQQADVFVGLLSDQTTGFDPLQALALPRQSGSVVVQFLNAQTMPGMAAVLANFSLIVLDNFTTSSLSHEQVMALQTWVDQGGALIEIGGPQWQRTLSPLPADLLPVSVYGTSTLSAGTHLLPVGGPTAGGPGPSVTIDKLQASVTVSTATVQANARAILSADTMPLLVQTQHGQGSICYLAFDPTLEPIVGWPGVGALWEGLMIRSLGEQLLPADTDPAPSVSTPYALAKLQHALLPYASPTPWALVLIFLCYLMILGPVRWLIVRRFKRRAWSWRIALGIIVVFSLFNYGVALHQQGTSMLSNSLSIIRLNHSGAVAHSTSYVGVYVPFVSADGNVQVHFPHNTLVQPFADYVLHPQPATITASSEGTDVNLPGIDLSALNAFRVEQDLPVQGGIISHLTLARGMLTGTITNTLPTALSDVYVLMRHSIVRLGTIGANQTIHVVLPLPVSATNVDLPTCGSLVNQVTMSSGGLPTGYDRLFYHDITRPLSEGQRHVGFLAFLLSSLQCSLSPVGAAGSPATLLGWADQPLDAVSTLTFNGIHPGGLHETLLLASLDIPTSAAASPILPSDVLPGRLVDAEAVSIRRLSAVSYALMKGQMTFEYSVPASAQGHIQRVTLTQSADGSTQRYSVPGGLLNDPAHMALYNWQTHSWNAITLSPSAPFSTQNTSAYVGPGGRMLVQCVNQESNLGVVAFTKPDLTVSGE